MAAIAAFIGLNESGGFSCSDFRDEKE